MTKNMFAFVGLLALVGGIGVWQFGYFTEVKETIERETAISRAATIVKQMEDRAASLTERARELRIRARSQEKEVERDIQQADKTKRAIGTLASAAKDAGLPKPSQAQAEDRSKTIAFAGRTLTAAEVYDTLEKWQSEVRTAVERLKVPRKMIEKMRSTADQLEQKQSQFLAQIDSTRSTLQQLEMQRDLAELDKELAELGASAAGNPAGELQGVLETLQKQIDEYEATSEVLSAETTSEGPLTPDEVLAGQVTEVSVRSELDALWDK